MHGEAAGFPQVRASALYNAACAYALLGDTENAFAALAAARRAGFNDRKQMRRDPDLASLRDDPRFAPPVGYAFHTLRLVEGTALEYALVLPEGFDKSKTYPVLLAMPPGSMSKGAVEYGMGAWWGEQAAMRGWIVVSPASPPGGWFEVDERTIPHLVKSLRGKYNIEGGKLHLAGCSNGGLSAFHVALPSPQYFHTLTSLPGHPPGSRSFDRLERLEGLRVHLFVGENDGGWAQASARAYERLQELGIDSTIKVFPGEGHVIGGLLADQLMLHLEEIRQRVLAADAG